MSTTDQNRLEGKSFEEVLKYQAKRCGLLARKNHLTARHLPSGRVQVEKSNLDFTLIDQQGNVGFFDAKSFAKDSFSFSQISPHQLELAKLYSEYSVPAGFIVFFRSEKIVSLFDSSTILSVGPGKSISCTEGLYLGLLWKFDLTLAFSQRKKTSN